MTPIQLFDTPAQVWLTVLCWAILLVLVLLWSNKQRDKEVAAKYKLNVDRSVAVSTIYYYEPMKTCPKGVTVILLNPGDSATFGIYDGVDTQWKGWFPMPRARK
jgi:hypothetical protein